MTVQHRRTGRYDSRGVDPTQPSGFQTGPGDLPLSEPLRDSRYQNIAAPDTDNANPTLFLPLGTVLERGGNRYVYIQASEAIAEGQVVTFDQSGATSVDVVASDDGGYTVTPQTSPSWTPDAYKGYFMTVDDGIGEGQTRRIGGNSADSLFLEDPLTTALTVAGVSDITIWTPYRVQLTDGATLVEPVVGVAITALTDEYYGFIQCEGLCEGVICDAAMTQNGFLSPSSANAGQALEAAAGETLDDANIFAQAAPGITITGTSLMRPARLFNCFY